MLLQAFLSASFLFLLSLGVLVSAFEFSILWLIPLMLLEVLVVYLMFTPLHDGAHFQISKRRDFNELALFLAWPILLGSPFLFRKIHLQHHAHVNEPKADPDHFTSSNRLWKSILKSFFLAFYYHWFFLKKVRCLRDLAHFSLSVLIPLFVLNICWLLKDSIGLALFMIWFLPPIFAYGLLSFTNTAWPHHPAKEVDRYKNTRNTYVPWVVQALMMNQNLHLVHHLKPNMPWYEYPEYLRQHEMNIQMEGAKTVSFTKRPDAYSMFPDWAVKVYSQIRNFQAPW
jgi:beta-carotene hydroxylase